MYLCHNPDERFLTLKMLPWFSLKSSHAHDIWHSFCPCPLSTLVLYVESCSMQLVWFFHVTQRCWGMSMLLHYSFLLTTSVPLCAFLTVVTVTSWIVACLQFLWIRLHWMFRYRSSWGHVSPFNKLVGKCYQPYLSWGMQESEKDTDWSECILAVWFGGILSYSAQRMYFTARFKD